MHIYPSWGVNHGFSFSFHSVLYRFILTLDIILRCKRTLQHFVISILVLFWNGHVINYVISNVLYSRNLIIQQLDNISWKNMYFDGCSKFSSICYIMKFIISKNPKHVGNSYLFLTSTALKCVLLNSHLRSRFRMLKI